MNETSLEAPPAPPSQEDKILAYLKQYENEWVSMPTLVAASNSYVIATRVSGLRKKGYVIEQRNEYVGKDCHSWYRLLP